MVSEQQMPSCHQRHELRAGDMLCGVLAEGEWVDMVIPDVDNESWRPDLIYQVARVPIMQRSATTSKENPS
jgi:hypothetical protein